MSQTMVVMIAALGVELVLLLIAVLSVAYLRNRAARRRDRAAIQALVARVRQERPRREQAIAGFLGTGLGYADAGVSESTALLARAELQLLHRFAVLYRDRNADLAGRFDGELNAMLEAYHALTAAAPAESAVEAAQPAVDEAELEALRRENERLSEELRITMETMSRMLNEYSTMFAPVGEPEALGSMPEAIDEVSGPVDDVPDPIESASGLAAQGDDDWAASADSATPFDDAVEEEWEVAVDTVGERDAAEAGDWEVAVDAPTPADDVTSADLEEDGEPEPEDPLAAIMRAAAIQEESARNGMEALAAKETAPVAEGKRPRNEPAQDSAGGDDVDLFDVVLEGNSTTVNVDSGATGGEAGDAGDDLFDVVEAPRSRSAS
jgi:hypothetical protein